VKLTFGLDDKPADWDGKLTVQGAEVAVAEPWGFEPQHDKFYRSKLSWRWRTVVRKGRGASCYAEPYRGLVLKLVPAGAQALLKVQTLQGSFQVPVKELRPGSPRLFLDGRASAELLADCMPPLPPTKTYDDFPTLATAADGHRWIAWIAWDESKQRDRLLTADLDWAAGAGGESSGGSATRSGSGVHVEPIAAGDLVANPQLIADSTGTLWLFWSAPRGANWDIWYARRQDGHWSAPAALTAADGSDFHLRAAAGPDGAVWVVWQSFRSGNSDIYAKCYRAGRWSAAVAVADSPANEWEPSVSCDPNGTAWVGYDTYQNGNYDVYLRSVSLDPRSGIKLGPPIAIATSPDFEAHAWVEATSGRAVWVAYDAAGPNWAKDYTRDSTTFAGKYAEPLHAWRRIELRAVVDGKLYRLQTPLPQRLHNGLPTRVSYSYQDEVKRFYELPQLARDGRGRLWLLFRLNRQGYVGHPRTGAVWEIYATTFQDGRWLEPILLPQSRGRQNQRAGTCVDKAGRLWCVWSTGHHHVDLRNQLRVGCLPELPGRVSEPPLAPMQLPKPTGRPEPPVASWSIERAGHSYKLFFGDLHRHTDISLCTPTVDGCLVDTLRYALDVAPLQFIAITNHTRDTDPYPWWRTQKVIDLFYVPGRLATIYAYERSNSMVGGGHRNVFFLKRGWPVIKADYLFPPPDRAAQTPDKALYPKLRGKDAFCIPHTPGYIRRLSRGTWTFNDPQVEPLAELIQAYRRDYEQPGQPRWSGARLKGKLAAEASLWYALARGYKIGFIASSDHFSTHLSFACAWAEGATREQIFEALRARRTYAATDKIVLDVRLGEKLLGETAKMGKGTSLSIHARGTGPIAEVQVVHGGKIIWRSEPGKAEFEAKVPIRRGPDAPGFYYVRLRQSDGNMAWSSPIWLE